MKLKQPDRNGYILKPNANGFDVFKIPQDRIEKYIECEQVYNHYNNIMDDASIMVHNHNEPIKMVYKIPVKTIEEKDI